MAKMVDCQHSSFGREDSMSMATPLQEIRKQSRSIDGPITRYILNMTTIIKENKLRREIFGVKDKKKPHKTILLVGETGVGKSTLINAMVNYLLGVRCNDRIWFEIIETKEEQVQSQTEIVTVYDVFFKESPISLTIIDSPGFASTEGKKADLEIAEMIHELCRSTDGVQEINVVGLVVSSGTTRLTDNQRYVFDSVLSLFGKDVEKNIVVFVTKARRKPRNAIEAIKQSKVPCARNNDGEPVYFRFNNSHCENFSDEGVLDDYEAVWNVLTKSMEDFLFFLNNRNTVSLKLTEAVLKKRKQLTSSISNLRDRITKAELKKAELEQTKAALQRHEKLKTDANNFEFELDEVYTELVPIESKWWNVSKEATYCTVCEENCHFPGCWWVRDLSRCSVMKDGKCTVCTEKCDYSKHEKSNKIYRIKTRRVKKTIDDFIAKNQANCKGNMSLITKLENEIAEQDKQKISLVEECYQCVMSLEEKALHKVSEFTLQNLNFLIERVKETGNTERVQKLENLKISAGFMIKQEKCVTRL